MGRSYEDREDRETGKRKKEHMRGDCTKTDTSGKVENTKAIIE